MRIPFVDIESNVPASRLEEAADLVRAASEYSLAESEPGYYQVISTRPSFHVEIHLLADGLAQVRCHCKVFARAKTCKHALAALLMLRDQLIVKKRVKTKGATEQNLLEETLRKMNITELRSFLLQYAKSHAQFRTELLANSMHLVRKPDYAALLLSITPMDKYGQLKINRNTIKNLRGVIATLLQQAQQRLKEKALPATFQILDPVIQHLHRMLTRYPAFQSQLHIDLKLATRIFEMLCHQAMAPRLQDAVIRFAYEVSHRDSYVMVKGMQPLMRMVESFVLEKKTRQEFFQLATQKSISDPAQQIQWTGLLVRWMRLWHFKASSEIKTLLAGHIADILLSAHRQQDPEDVLFLLPMLDYARLSRTQLHSSLHAGFRAARTMHDPEWSLHTARELCLHFQDEEAWAFLMKTHEPEAEKVLQYLSDRYAPGANEALDAFILQGWSELHQPALLYERLSALDRVDWMMQYDGLLKKSFGPPLIEWYARALQSIREMYGGAQARQKLNAIFTHLKSVDLFVPVTERIKAMEKVKQEDTNTPPGRILGFVFDLDGVIVDTAVHHFNAWRRLLREFGTEIEDEDDHHTRGASRMESLEYLLQKYHLHFTPEEKEVLASRKNGYYLESIEGITPADLLPGSLEFLIASREAGLLLALGSASKNARGVLQKLGIEDRFDAILDGNDAKASKPDPEIFTKACEALRLPPDTVVVFEDAVKGVQAALAAGCHVVGIGDPAILPLADLVIPNLAAASPAALIAQLV